MFSSIMVGTDGSETAATAVHRAFELARTHGATLHVVTAYQPVLSSRLQDQLEELPQELRWMASPGERAEVILRDTVTELGGDLDVQTHAFAGDAADVLLEAADDLGVDVIVVGSKGMTGVQRFLLGSVPNKVAHHATCDVLIVRTT